MPAPTQSPPRSIPIVRAAAASLTIALLAACGGEPGTSVVDGGIDGGDAADDVVAIDAVDALADLADTSGDLGAADADTDGAPVDADASGDGSGDPDVREPAELGEPCETDDDCASSYCVDLVQGEGGGLCASRCIDEASCPDGFECLLIDGTGGDVERICLPENLCIDPDGDRWGVGSDCLGADCDEGNAAINPGADEVCDSLDNDCDLRIDDGPVDAGSACVTGFPGVCATGTTVCASGLLDCVEDTPPTGEVCDGLDNDCDGAIDEDLAQYSFYPDGDSDGFGAAGEPAQLGCERPLGTAQNAGDCNDRDSAVYPGAPEVIGDGIDQSCDGAELCYADRDQDGWRTDEPVVSTAADCVAPGVASASTPSGDCADASSTRNPGVAETPGDGIDANCDNAESCYADADGDGARATTLVDSTDFDCADPREALATAPIDCDDRTGAAAPGQVEVCDTIDNDCDTQIDEGAGCYAIGDPCGDAADCASGFCIDGLCSAGGCAVPGACPARVAFGGAVGGGVSGGYTFTLMVGVPAAASAADPTWFLLWGPVAWTTDP